VDVGAQGLRPQGLRPIVQAGRMPSAPTGEGGLPKGWRWKKIEDIGANEKYAIVDGPFGSNLKVSDYVENGDVPVISISNIDDGFERDKLRFITRNKFDEVKRSAVKPGDILVAKIGSSYGKVGYYPEWLAIGIIPANLLKITVSKSVVKQYVYYYLKSRNFKNHLDGITKSTAQPAFNVSMFRKLPIPLPPLEEQQRIVAEVERRLESARAIESVVEVGLKRARRLRQAVLRSAFEGRLG
jgi:type I restriction enzyme S subunit